MIYRKLKQTKRQTQNKKFKFKKHENRINIKQVN